MTLTATFIIHEPHPRSDQDWNDIYDALEAAGNEVGLTLTGTVAKDQANYERASAHGYGPHH